MSEPTKEAREARERAWEVARRRSMSLGIEELELRRAVDEALDAFAAEAIERCAKIAEDRALTVAGHEAGVIACLIRYLKEPGR